MPALKDRRPAGDEASEVSPLRLDGLDDDTLALLIEYLCGQTPRAARGRPARHDVQAAEGAAGREEGHRGEDTLPPADAGASLTNFGGIDQLKTLENMEVFESWAETRLSCDNRIPFQFASVELNDSTREIVDSVKGFLDRHKNVRVRLDSHCGTAAPDGVAAAFSHIRGLAILSSVCGSDDDGGESMRVDRSRVLVRAWGKQISEKVARLDGHRFAELAQEGRGWVEVSFLLPPSGEDGEPISLPPRPQYFNADDVCPLVIN
ncbi:hypothetical protein THAOC_12081 [Thalassiosira oceanica]|uniref:Uncharacterized protein n=1 Tax=Thalassiosira oceanica TaxID=159749 RepID=K0SNJ3_THAOC|nr:hypothetical protein THAOC_12081 [Thalassiosira oceanica]|eukprot:EJK66945.1 hypothetical protein THAOC_12081 [Thalassiosira oceanica]